MLAPIAHQRRIREREAANDPHPTMATLEGCTVEQIPFAEAKAIVSQYEWLRTMPTVTRACHGLRTPEGELAGVAVFAAGPAPESGALCGPEHRDRTICLARGGCVHTNGRRRSATSASPQSRANRSRPSSSPAQLRGSQAASRAFRVG
jgi:hypothetical protein